MRPLRGLLLSLLLLPTSFVAAPASTSAMPLAGAAAVAGRHAFGA